MGVIVEKGDTSQIGRRAKDKVVDKADSFATTLEGKIKARPLAAVGIAFGIGYFAMRIFRR